jgi:hypothetical protein
MKRANAQAQTARGVSEAQAVAVEQDKPIVFTFAPTAPPRRLRRLVGTLLNLEREARDVIAERIYALLRVRVSVAAHATARARNGLGRLLGDTAGHGRYAKHAGQRCPPHAAVLRGRPGLRLGWVPAAVVQPPLGCESRNWWTSPIRYLTEQPLILRKGQPIPSCRSRWTVFTLQPRIAA